jgi:phosphoribosylaminoimidazole carboxylase
MSGIEASIANEDSNNNNNNVIIGSSTIGTTSTTLLQSTPIIVACIGGGQLGQMMAMVSTRLNIQMLFLDPLGTNCPASYCVPTSSIVHGNLNDTIKIHELVTTASTTATATATTSSSSSIPIETTTTGAHVVVTMETEHINVVALEEIEKQQLQLQQQQLQQQQIMITVVPSSYVMKIIQDKFFQKEHFTQHGIPVPPYMKCTSIHDIMNACMILNKNNSSDTKQQQQQQQNPIMLKSRHGGYDGKGNVIIQSQHLQSINDIILCVKQLIPSLQQNTITNEHILSLTNLDLYAEGWINFTMEVAVMVVKSIHNDNTNDDITNTANNLYSTRAYPVVNAIQDNKSICRIVIAPAQNLPLSIQTKIQQLAIQCIDTLGSGAAGVFGVEMFIIHNNNNTTTTTTKASQPEYDILINEIAPRPHNTGHYTQDACAISQFENHLRAISGLPLGSTKMIVPVAAMVNILGPPSNNSTCDTGTSSSSNNQDAFESCNVSLQNDAVYNSVVHWYNKKEIRPGRKLGHINLTANTYKELVGPLSHLMNIEQISLSYLPTIVNTVPIVGVIMGSQSDLPTMNDAVTILKEFSIPYEVDIVSAHRTPDKLMIYARSAVKRGIQVIIAGAGGAAHLPGMVASMTPLPVIGVPIKTSTLNGIDSLYSIVQMPKGIPVATVAIGNATNAGLLAVRMLAMTSKSIQEQMILYQTNLCTSVQETSTKLIQLGSDEYLQQMDNKNKSVNV